eukprot:CFRG7952T1
MKALDKDEDNDTYNRKSEETDSPIGIGTQSYQRMHTHRRSRSLNSLTSYASELNNISITDQSPVRSTTANARRPSHQQVPRSRRSGILTLGLLAVVEKCITYSFVTFQEYLLITFPVLNRIVSWICLSFSLQVLGVLWAFNINAISNLALMAGAVVARADIGNISATQLLATAYVIYATLSVLITFGKFTWHTGLAGLKHFPRQRQMILLDRGSQSVMLCTLFIILAGLVTLIAVPRLCLEPEENYGAVQLFCQSSMVPNALTQDSSVVVTITACLAVALTQVIQFVCYEIPMWSVALRGRRMGKLILHILLMFALVMCTLVVVNWIEDVAGASLIHWTELVRPLPKELQFLSVLESFTFAETRLYALTSICLFLVGLLIFSRLPPKPINNFQAQLAINLVKRIKFTLIFMMNTYILLAALHPQGGMVFALEHLFVISMATPVMYITLHSLSTMFMKTSYKQLLVFSPIVGMATTTACTTSTINGNMSYFLVFVHLFGLVVDMYGFSDIFRPFLPTIDVLDSISITKLLHADKPTESEVYQKRRNMAIHFSRKGSFSKNNSRLSTAELQKLSPRPREKDSPVTPCVDQATSNNTVRADAHDTFDVNNNDMPIDNAISSLQHSPMLAKKSAPTNTLGKGDVDAEGTRPTCEISNKPEDTSTPQLAVRTKTSPRLRARLPPLFKSVKRSAGHAKKALSVKFSEPVPKSYSKYKQFVDEDDIGYLQNSEHDQQETARLAYQFSRVGPYADPHIGVPTKTLLSACDLGASESESEGEGELDSGSGAPVSVNGESYLNQKSKSTNSPDDGSDYLSRAMHVLGESRNVISPPFTEEHTLRRPYKKNTSCNSTLSDTCDTYDAYSNLAGVSSDVSKNLDSTEWGGVEFLKEKERMGEYRRARHHHRLMDVSLITQAVRFVAQLLIGLAIAFGLIMMTLSTLAYLQDEHAPFIKSPIHMSTGGGELTIDNAYIVTMSLARNTTTHGLDESSGVELGTKRGYTYLVNGTHKKTSTFTHKYVSTDARLEHRRRNTHTHAPHIPLYSICGRRWHGLSVLDYALLSEASYFPPDKQSEVVANMFISRPGIPQPAVVHMRKNPDDLPTCVKGHDVEGDCISTHNTRGRSSWRAKFMEVYFAELDLTVIAVQGTDPANIGDVVEDVRMWTETVVYQILSWTYPIVRMWPDHLVAFVVENLFEWLSLVGLNNNHWYYHKLIDHVQNIARIHPDRSIVITGHSLGGGLARIAGYLSGRSSLTFSAPGIAHTYRKVRLQTNGSAEFISKHHLHHKTMNIMPDHDLIAMLDSQAGMVQQLRCKAESPACHLLELSICELLNQCGDVHHRFTKCTATISPKRFLSAIWDIVKPVVIPLLVLGTGQILLLLLLRFTYNRTRMLQA